MVSFLYFVLDMLSLSHISAFSGRLKWSIWVIGNEINQNFDIDQSAIQIQSLYIYIGVLFPPVALSFPMSTLSVTTHGSHDKVVRLFHPFTAHRYRLIIDMC